METHQTAVLYGIRHSLAGCSLPRGSVRPLVACSPDKLQLNACQCTCSPSTCSRRTKWCCCLVVHYSLAGCSLPRGSVRPSVVDLSLRPVSLSAFWLSAAWLSALGLRPISLRAFWLSAASLSACWLFTAQRGLRQMPALKISLAERQLAQRLGAEAKHLASPPRAFWLSAAYKHPSSARSWCRTYHFERSLLLFQLAALPRCAV